MVGAGAVLAPGRQLAVSRSACDATNSGGRDRCATTQTVFAKRDPLSVTRHAFHGTSTRAVRSRGRWSSHRLRHWCREVFLSATAMPKINVAAMHDFDLGATLAADRTEAKPIRRGAENLEHGVLRNGPRFAPPPRHQSPLALRHPFIKQLGRQIRP